MSFSYGRDSFSDNDILSLISETSLAALYLNVLKLPCVLNNPLRKDSHPSLGLFATPDGRVRYKDFATKDSGTLIEFLCQYWSLSKELLKAKLLKEVTSSLKINSIKISSLYSEIPNTKKSLSSNLQCKVRKWYKRDINYWGSYGIPINWLKWAEVYPISHTIITIGNNRYVFGTDPLAYVFVEHKDNNTTLKVYLPLNKIGRKWLNKNDKSVIGLWTKVPPEGNIIVICSSLKDSLCLSANTGIPAIYIQGEGYSISKTAQKSLRSRYKKIYIILDNDKPGIENSTKLAKETGFTNIILPQVEGAKDISDIYHKWQDKNKFIKFIKQLFLNN